MVLSVTLLFVPITLLGHLWQLLRLAQRGRPTYLSKTKRAKAVLCPFMCALNLLQFSLVLSTRLLPGSRWGSTWAFAVHTVVLYKKSSYGEGHPGSPHLRHLQTPGSCSLELTGFTVNTDSPSLAASLSSRDSATRPAEPL